MRLHAILKVLTAARLFRDQRGATMIEYALLAALIAVAAIVALGALGDGLSAIFTSITQELSDAVA